MGISNEGLGGDVDIQVRKSANLVVFSLNTEVRGSAFVGLGLTS